tara:strand:+ start:2587 stop:2811 length:225 start_codon:yes stop_codon:yes gene_type:complete
MKKNYNLKVKKIVKGYRNVNFRDNDDLYQKGILDSMDIMNVIVDIEKMYGIKLNLNKSKNFKFSISNLVKKIKK